MISWIVTYNQIVIRLNDFNSIMNRLRIIPNHPYYISTNQHIYLMLQIDPVWQGRSHQRSLFFFLIYNNSFKIKINISITFLFFLWNKIFMFDFSNRVMSTTKEDRLHHNFDHISRLLDSSLIRVSTICNLSCIIYMYI